MTRNKKIIAVVASVAALGGGGAAIASATGAVGGDSEKPINGPALEQASAAALAHTGQGSVSDTEVGDEESSYEVEVTLDDGSETDVQLDRDFNVVGSEADQGGEDEKGGE
jgi:uncharacterized membrane protein YkoI